MAAYQKVYSSLHHDQRFLALSDDGKLCYLLTFTHPSMNALGAMRTTTEGLAAEYGWEHPRLVAAFRELSRLKLIDWDPKARLLAFPEYMTGHAARSANAIVKAWPAALQSLPPCPALKRLAERVSLALRALPDDVRRDIPQTVVAAFTAKSRRSETTSRTPSGTPSLSEAEADSDPEADPDSEAAAGAASSSDLTALEVILRARDRGGVEFDAKDMAFIDSAEALIRNGAGLSPAQRGWFDRLVKRARRGKVDGYTTMRDPAAREAWRLDYERRIKEKGLM